MNLFDLPLFAVRQGAQFKFLTLEAAFRSCDLGQIGHPTGFMEMPSRMLAQAMTQWLAAHAGNVPKGIWQEGVLGNEKALGQIADLLFSNENIERAKNGFDIFGETAFMQMPAGIFNAEKNEPEPIDGLFQPFRPRRTGTAKALRTETDNIKQICPHCAALGVFSTHSFSGAMAQYWGSAPTRGACVYNAELPKVGPSILANVLYGEHRAMRKDLKPMPWVPDSKGHGGFDADGRLPFERATFDGEKMIHPANVVFPFVRAMRLIPPPAHVGHVAHAADAVGTCDTCGRQGESLVVEFSLLSEVAILALVTQETKDTWPKEFDSDGKLLDSASKVIARNIDPSAIHPSLAYILPRVKNDQPDEAKEALQTNRVGSRYPQMIAGSMEGFNQLKPAWVQLIESLREADSIALIFKQLMDPALSERLTGDLGVHLFGVQFEGATNPNPKFLLDASYGVGKLLMPKAIELEFGSAGADLVAHVDAVFKAWIDAAQSLDYDLEEDKGNWSRKVPGSKPRKKQIRTAVLFDAALWTESRKLWDLAFSHIHSIAKAMAIDVTDFDAEDRNKFDESLVMARQEAKNDIVAAGRKSWARFLSSRPTEDASMRDLYLRTLADNDFQKSVTPKAAKVPKAAKAPKGSKNPKAKAEPETKSFEPSSDVAELPQ